VGDLTDVVRRASQRPLKDAAFFVAFNIKIGRVEGNVFDILKSSHFGASDSAISEAIAASNELEAYCRATQCDWVGDPEKARSAVLKAKYDNPRFIPDTYGLIEQYVRACGRDGTLGAGSIDGLQVSGTPFRLGDALGKTFSVSGRQFGKFVLLTLIPMIPLLLFTLLPQPGLMEGSTGKVTLFRGILTYVLTIIAQATTLYGAFQEMRGEAFTIGQSLTVGLRRALPLIGVAICAGLAIGLATLLLVVPGLIVACMLYVAVPVCVIEQSGPTASIRRSAMLTRGYRWPIFGLLLLVGIIGYVAGILLIRFRVDDVIWAKLLYFSWQVISTSFGAVLASVVYHDLRAAKEGIDINHLVNVFD
jgi:hypothetical protein